jgi:O-antigen/teichoic acid export membrane protein
MSHPSRSRTDSAGRFTGRHSELRPHPGRWNPLLQRIATNFALLGVAEILCRAVSVVVMLTLAKRLNPSGFGRIEFAFNIVFWLVLIVRDCFETIVTREIARHPRLTRRLVNHVLAVKLSLALGIFGVLSATSFLTFTNPVDQWILVLYGLLLLSTAMGLDFVFRGNEAMGLVALSLFVRTAVYCVGVWLWVDSPSRILLVPVWLATGEFTGIALVWVVYSRKYGIPRPVLGFRFLVVLLRRGRSIGLIHLCQAVIVSVDLLVVGLVSQWADVGRYGAPLRMISAVMAFGMITQQVVFPALSRNWRTSPEAGRRLLDFAVRVLVTGFLPIAVGGALLAEPLVQFLLPSAFHESGILLAIGIWRAPLLSLAFLYQASLIAMNKERQGLRLLLCGAVASAPLIALFQGLFGFPGASLAVLLVGLGLVVAGYSCLWQAGCQPPVHHHLVRPLIASAVMVPVCLVALRLHVVVAVLAGAVTYLIALKMIGGLDYRLCELFEPNWRQKNQRIDQGT